MFCSAVLLRYISAAFCACVCVCSILMQFVRFGSVGCSFSLISLFKRLFIYADCSNLQFGDLQLQRLECLSI